MAEERRTWSERLASYAKSVCDEAIMPAAQKLVPQGAAELAQALYTGSGYMPYGPTEKPVPMEAMDNGGVHGPDVSQEQQPPVMNESSVHGKGEYQKMLSGFTARGRDAQERQNDLER
jgi:hypothetical protein